jgi:hypothetical protein
VTLINNNDLGAVIGALLLVITLLFPAMGPMEVMANSNSIDSQKINLNIIDVFSLENTTSVRYERTFSLSEKQPVSLVHVDCMSSEDTVKSVLINVTINGIETSEVFKDSSTDYSAPYTFNVGSTLTTHITSTTPLYILSNTISIEIKVTTASNFGQDLGLFQIQGVIYETFSPPEITASSENISLPLTVSQGVWYISPLSILRERKFYSEVFVDFTEKIRVRLDISFTPSDAPLSSSIFTVTNGLSVYESTELSSEHTIIADLSKGDTLYLSFKFRPSTELTESTIALDIDVSVSGIPYIPNNNPSGTENGLEFANISISSLELLRITIIVVPLVIFYMRRTNKKSNKKPIPTENIS